MLKKSVTAVLYCPEKESIFVVKRLNSLNAFGGYLSFPGGKVEKTEESIGALLRELSEELNLVGENFNQFLRSIRGIYPLGKAITPEFSPLRFENSFYLIELSSCLPFEFTRHEFEWGRWGRGEEFLDLFDQGNQLIVHPTFQILKSLKNRKHYQKEEWKDLNLEIKSDECAVIEPLKDFFQIFVASNTLPPFHHTNCFLIQGKESAFIVDPSPKDEAEFKKLKKTLTNYKVKKIFLTHHHPDHIEDADVLARELNLPIALSDDTHQRICARLGCHYFKGVKVEIIKENDIIGDWLGNKVVALAVPGHDEGQMALMSENKFWIIAGDLYQGMGSVVIAPPEGHMGRYFSSMKKVLNLKVYNTFPSHGFGSGGDYVIEKNLEHRKMREDQVLKLLQAKKSEEEMLEIIYQGIAPELRALALINIRSHMQKLKEEGINF